MNATITRSDDADGPVTLTIELDPPLAYKLRKSKADATLDAIVLREPTARQVREAEKERTADAPFASQVAYELRLIQMVGNLDAEVMDLLPVLLVNHAAAFLDEFVDAEPTEEDKERREADQDEDAAPPEPETFPINPPIKWAGSEYAELDIREPLASEIRNARQLIRNSGNLFESRRAIISLVTAVSGLPAPVVEGLGISTLNKAGVLLGRFTTAGRRTGKR